MHLSADQIQIRDLYEFTLDIKDDCVILEHSSPLANNYNSMANGELSLQMYENFIKRMMQYHYAPATIEINNIKDKVEKYGTVYLLVYNADKQNHGDVIKKILVQSEKK